MPPDIVRPVASTTVGNLIAMVHRLGMGWTEFRLDEGRLRATGDGRTFSTSIVRGMGLVVEYSATGSHSMGGTCEMIHSIAADKVRNSISVSLLQSYNCQHEPMLGIENAFHCY